MRKVEDRLAVLRQPERSAQLPGPYGADTAEPLIRLGASANAWLPNGFVQTAVLISDYQKWVVAGQVAVVRGYCIN